MKIALLNTYRVIQGRGGQRRFSVSWLMGLLNVDMKF
jgi:hypothetical protein